MNCFHCGKEIKDGARFCRYCGEKMHNDQRSAEQRLNERNSVETSSIPQWVFIIFLCAIIVGFIIFIALLSNKSSLEIINSVGVSGDIGATSDIVQSEALVEPLRINDMEEALGHTPNYCAIVQDSKTSLYGFIDSEGNWRVPPIFSRIYHWEFSYNGIATAIDSVTGLYGCINEFGEWVVQPTHQDDSGLLEIVKIGALDKPRIEIKRDDVTGLFGVINNEEWTIAPIYEQIISGSSVYYGVKYMDKVILYAKETESHLWGIIDEQGNWVVKPSFAGNNPPIFSRCGLAAKMDQDSELWGFINIHGEWIIEPKFRKRYDFGDDGFALIKDDTSGLYGIIDISGNWVSEPSLNIADDVVTFSPFFSGNGLMGLIEKETLKVGYIDHSGNWSIAPQYGTSTIFNDINNPYDYWYGVWAGVSG